ncbi:MAG: dihydrodipicolinate synthase family protein [Bryobacterales bacterium]|nr:dihydrodipicolinate synthase family protein [Bryobacterales bacterium]
MASFSHSGINIAAVTPHKREGHEPDIAATLDLVDFYCAAGAKGIALLGSTGEFLHLKMDDRIRLLNLAVKRSRVPIIAGVSHSTLDGAVELARAAASAGAAAGLLMPPYFFRYRQQDVKEFYLEYAKQMQGALPTLLYNIPFFTTPLEFETSRDLLRTGHFAGIKDSSGDLDNFRSLLGLRKERPFTLFVGNDVVFSTCRTEGADGVISGVASAVPELMLALDESIASGNAAKTVRLEVRLQEFIGWLNRFPAPVGVKAATEARGLKVGPLAVPLSPADRDALDQFKSWFKGWLPLVLGESAAA